MRVCLVYDHLFPQTIGGMERWLRDLALRLAGLGHEVTYLTMRHWEAGSEPVLPGVRIVGLVDPGRVYSADRRAFGPPLAFGLAVARHLARHGRNYDVVHTASFPYFPILAAGAFRRSRGYRIVVDWPEVWTRRYWRHYAGALGGTTGWLVQRACLRVPHRAHAMSRLHARRLVEEGYRGDPVVLPGLYAGPTEASKAEKVDPSLVVYAGRHVKEKRVPALVRAFAHARAAHPELRLEIYGDGPERQHVATLVKELGLDGSVDVAGRKPEEVVTLALGRAACLATASEREGYGLVVVEAAAHATPSAVVAGPENAVTELIDEGVNGTIAASANAEELGAAILRVVRAGAAMRDSTAGWFQHNAPNLRLDRSLDLVVGEYESSGRAEEPET